MAKIAEVSTRTDNESKEDKKKSTLSYAIAAVVNQGTGLWMNEEFKELNTNLKELNESTSIDCQFNGQ